MTNNSIFVYKLQSGDKTSLDLWTTNKDKNARHVFNK